MKNSKRVACQISMAGCKAPAGIGIPGTGYADGFGHARGECWACGDPVCGNCSALRVWRDAGRRRVRICDACEPLYKTCPECNGTSFNCVRCKGSESPGFVKNRNTRKD